MKSTEPQCRRRTKDGGWGAAECPEAAGPGGWWLSRLRAPRDPGLLRPQASAPTPVCGGHSPCGPGSVPAISVTSGRLGPLTWPRGPWLRPWSPACPAPTVPPGFCFPPSQQFPSASPRCMCGSLSPPVWGQARPGRAGARGACADRRGPVRAGGRRLACGRPRPLCLSWSSAAVSWAGTGSQGSGCPAGRGERRGERHRGRGPRGREEWALGASSPLKPPGPSRPVRGPRWSSPGGPTERRAVRRGHWPTLALCAHLQVESAVV